MFNSRGGRVRCANLELEGLDLCIDIVLLAVRGSRFVDEVEEDDDDEGRGEGIKHRRRLKLQGKLQSL
jgi:hypothetical protein